MRRSGERRVASWLHRTGTVGLAITVASAGLLTVSATPAAAWSDGKCQDDRGVTVVVDYQSLGGGILTRCADVQAGATGLDALRAAGVSISGTARWGESFVCRLNNRPAADEPLPISGNEGYLEPCVDTPPGSAYWSYWSASNGGAWTYSSRGVANRAVTIGGFEGWSFSMNNAANANPAPGVVPSRPAAPVAPPPGAGDSGGSSGASNGAASADTGGAGAGGGAAQGAAGDTNLAAGSGGSGTDQRSDAGQQSGTSQSGPSADATTAGDGAADPSETDKPTDGASVAQTGSAGDSTGTLEGDATVQAAEPAGPSGIPAGTAIALGLIAVVAGAAGGTMWLRRR